MEVRFTSRRLEKCYQESKRAVRAWGTDVARKYIARVQALYAAREFDDLLTIQSLGLHKLKGERAKEYAIKLHGRWRLILVRITDDTVLVQEVTNHYGD